LPQEIPDQFSGDDRNRLHADLLRAHSRWLANPFLDDCLNEAYDAFANALIRSNQPLSDGVLAESIPGWVFQWAVVQGWLPYPPLRRLPRTSRVRGNLIEGWIKPSSTPSYAPVGPHELTATLGTYKVTDWYRADIMKRLASRIAHWRAEALSSPPALPPPIVELITPPAMTEPLLNRERRLQTFVRDKSTSIAAICRTANVHKPNMQQWRHNALSEDSVMSQRIEDVLSGKTPLVFRGKKKG